MVIVLVSQLPDLIYSSGMGPAVPTLCKVGDLRPDYQTQRVAGVVHLLRLLIMRQPHCICSHLPDNNGILPGSLPAQRIAEIEPVLVTAYSAQRIQAIVQEKSLLTVQPK